MSTGVDVERAWLLELLERYGRNLHSFMILEPGLSVWKTDDAAIAYAQRGGYWVAVGGPLCSAERSVEVAKAFRAAASAGGCRVVFFGVTQPFVDRLQGTDFDALQIGLAPSWQPTQWSEVVSTARKLRNRLSKAQRDGITCRLLSIDQIPPESELRQRLVEMANQWMTSKSLPPMGFMVTVELFQHGERRRYFIAEHAGCICGLAVCIPVYGKNGWLLEDMILAPDAPGGCSELLVDTVMRQLAAEQAELVSLGMVALAGLDTSHTPEHPWLSRFLRVCSRSMGWLYNFQGLYRFRNKMQPKTWEPIYIVSGSRIGFLTIRAILMAFAQGWVPRFGVRVLGHWVEHKLPWPGRASERRARKPRLDVLTFGLATASLATLVIAILTSYYDIGPAWLSLVLGTLAAYVGFTPVHEAVHGNVSRYPWLNNLVGHLCSIPLNGAFTPYRYLHGQHHLHTNDQPNDPDFWSGQGRAWLLPLRWATQDVGYLRFYFGRWNERPLFERSDLLLSALMYALIAVVTLAFMPQLFVALLLGWFLPARIALFLLAATFSWLPHAPHRETDPHRATSVHSASWLTWALLGQNFHLVHHLNPGIPFYRLQRTWRDNREQLISQGAVDRKFEV